jgi:hypothetical protein
VDDAQANDSRVGGVSAPKTWDKAPKKAPMGQKTGKLVKNSLPVSPHEHSSINSRFGRVVQTILTYIDS